MLAVRTANGRASFVVRVMPRASSNAIAGERDGQLLARVTAAPVDGAANDALTRLLSAALGVPRSEVRVEQGAAARTKRVSVPEGAKAALLRLAAPGRGNTSPGPGV